MCSVIGCYLENPTKDQIHTLKNIFHQSKVRGKHATGASFLKEGVVHTFKSSLPSDEFIESPDFLSIVPGNYTLQLIGHTRYSTSDLRFNQPIQLHPESAIAHNGVIDQRPPENWGEYGYDLETANDSELVYHCVLNGQEPLEQYPEASMAVVELTANSGLRWYRNAKRPLYHAKVSNGWFICSTKDIAERAGLENAERCQPGVVYAPLQQKLVKEIKEMIP